MIAQSVTVVAGLTSSPFDTVCGRTTVHSGHKGTDMYKARLPAGGRLLVMKEPKLVSREQGSKLLEAWVVLLCLSYMMKSRRSRELSPSFCPL